MSIGPTKLSIIERIYLGQMLETVRGNYVMLKGVRDAMEVMTFTDEEKDECGIKDLPNGAGVQVQTNKEMEYSFADDVDEKVKDILLKLDESNSLEQHHMSLYEKFVIADK